MLRKQQLLLFTIQFLLYSIFLWVLGYFKIPHYLDKDFGNLVHNNIPLVASFIAGITTGVKSMPHQQPPPIYSESKHAR